VCFGKIEKKVLDKISMKKICEQNDTATTLMIWKWSGDTILLLWSRTARYYEVSMFQC